jgi:dimethylargininase
VESKYAIVRTVPGSYDRCVTTQAAGIDVALARRQHAAYCSALEQAGVKLVVLEADDRLPDCCFVEDTVIVVDELAIITRPGAPSRREEVKAVEKAISEFKNIRRILPPGTIDGGDVLQIGMRIFIGLSARTTPDAVEQVHGMVSPLGYEVIPVPVHDTLHLKSAVTALNDSCLVMAAGYFDERLFADFRQLTLPMEETYAANCLCVNDTVIIPSGFPVAKAMIEAEGFSLKELDNSEFRKGDGALTCLSVLF